ncbi:hypothetical protein J6590_105827 [Homalodisca vitripennis]|nr:hypothetical protein J6590_105827 [Homalodisca vitripennis]
MAMHSKALDFGYELEIPEFKVLSVTLAIVYGKFERNDERSAVEASLPVREIVDNEFLYILMTSSRVCGFLTGII